MPSPRANSRPWDSLCPIESLSSLASWLIVSLKRLFWSPVSTQIRPPTRNRLPRFSLYTKRRAGANRSRQKIIGPSQLQLTRKIWPWKTVRSKISQSKAMRTRRKSRRCKRRSKTWRAKSGRAIKWPGVLTYCRCRWSSWSWLRRTKSWGRQLNCTKARWSCNLSSCKKVGKPTHEIAAHWKNRLPSPLSLSCQDWTFRHHHHCHLRRLYSESSPSQEDWRSRHRRSWSQVARTRT